MNETTLSGRNLFKLYGNRTVVSDVSVEVKTGEVVGLLGPNGAGKTTTFYMVTGMIRPNSGSVFLGDQDITRAPMYQRARAGIGYLPQEASIFRKLSVEDNLRLVCETLEIDIWIAAAALEVGARLVSYDSHFDVLSGLRVLAP